MAIKSLEKALRIQKARFKSGKPGFSRAVRRFIAEHSTIFTTTQFVEVVFEGKKISGSSTYDILNKFKNERRGRSQGKDKPAGNQHAPATHGIFQRAVNFQQEARRG